MENRIIVSGFGGQGVLLIGQVLCHAGMMEGKDVSWLPSYGPEMRGGTASCSVIISDGEIGSPLVTNPQHCIVMNHPSFEKYVNAVEDGGSIYINSSLIGKPQAKEGTKAFYVPTNEAAQKAGNARTANMAMMGAFVENSKVCGIDSVFAALTELFGERRAHLLPVNKEAMELGAEMAEQA